MCIVVVASVYNLLAWANWLLIFEKRFYQSQESGLAEVQQLTPFLFPLTLMPKVGVGRVSTNNSMPTYRVKFLLGVELHEFAMDCPNTFTSKDEPEVLKEEAAALIRAFHKTFPDVKVVAPKSIILECDRNVILKCDDLTENSVNHLAK